MDVFDMPLNLGFPGHQIILFNDDEIFVTVHIEYEHAMIDQV